MLTLSVLRPTVSDLRHMSTGSVACSKSACSVTTSSARQHISEGVAVSDQPDHRSALFGDNEMKLGTFCLNISGGMMMSTAAKNTLDWRENVAVAQAADS